MQSKKVSSSYGCWRCGTELGDGSFIQDCCRTCRLDGFNISKNSPNYISIMREEIKYLRDELESVKEQHKSDIKRLNNSITAMKSDIKTNSHNADVLEEDMKDKELESIKKNGVELSEANMKTIKKIAKKIAIREITDWDSE